MAEAAAPLAVEGPADDQARATAATGQRLAHLTTVDMSLALLLETELRHDIAAGFDVYGISAPGPYTPRLREWGVTHVPVPALTRTWHVRRDVLAAVQLWRVLRRLRPDVLHTHTPKAGVLGRVLGRLAGVPVVVNTCHGLWATPEDPLLRRALVYAAEAVAARFSHAELYQNDDDRERLRRTVPSHRAWTVGNGTDLRRFRPDRELRDVLRRELGVAADTVVVVGVGRRVAEKGLREFAATAAALSERACFVWVGPDDPDKPDRMDGSSAAIRFLGLRHDVEAIYNAADIFVLPSHREGFSRSAMEAAATGCAMVLSDIRGCREVGGHGVELLLVPPRDVSALTAAVSRLIEDASLREQLGRAARRRAVQHFDQHRIADRSIRTYQVIAARKEPRP